MGKRIGPVFGRAQASHVSIVYCEGKGCMFVGRVLPLCASMFYFQNAGDFCGHLPPKHPAGPAHLAGLSRMRDSFFKPSSPTFVPSDQFIFSSFNFFFLMFCTFYSK